MADKVSAPLSRDRTVRDWRRWANFWRLRRHVEDGVWIEYYVSRRKNLVTFTRCGLEERHD